jgi:hypothetical protein
MLRVAAGLAMTAPELPPHADDRSNTSWRPRLTWSPDLREVTATAIDAKGQPSIVVTFKSPDAVIDAFTRVQMEQAAIGAVRGLLGW